MAKRQVRRRQEREGRNFRERQAASPGGAGSVWSRLSTDWIVGGIIGGVILIAVLVYLFSNVFSGGGSAANFSQVFSISVNPAEPQTMLLGDASGLYRSTNGGRDWNEEEIREPVRSIFHDSNNPGVVFAAGGGSLWSSQDAGRTWDQLSTDLPPGSIGAADKDPSGQGTWYAYVGANGLFRSNDGGATWRLQHEVPNAVLTSVAVKPGAPDTLYAFHTVDGFVISTDGGLHLDPAGEGLPARGVTDILTFAAEPETVFAAAGRQVYKSTDSGRTWTSSSEGLASVQVIALSRDPNTGTLYAVDLWLDRRG